MAFPPPDEPSGLSGNGLFGGPSRAAEVRAEQEALTSVSRDLMNNAQIVVNSPVPAGSMGNGGQQSLFSEAEAPIPRPTVLFSPEAEKMTLEEEDQAIGAYMRNFVTYGLVPKVEMVPSNRGWKVTLEGHDGDTFIMGIVADSLVGALRQADMAAGGWHAQREIEKNVLGKKNQLSAGGVVSGSSSAPISQLLGGIQEQFDRMNVPVGERVIIMHPDAYKRLSEEYGDSLHSCPVSEGAHGTWEGVPIVIDRTVKSNQPLMVRDSPGSVPPVTFAAPSPSPASNCPDTHTGERLRGLTKGAVFRA